MASEQQRALLPSSPASRQQIPWRHIAWFVVGTFAITWLVVSPLYFLDDPLLFQTLYLPVTVTMMLIPAVMAALIVRKTQPKGQRSTALGFTRHRPFSRFFGYLVLAFIFPVALTLCSLPLASAFGVFEADLANFSGLRQLFAEAGVTGMSIELIMLTQIINVVLAAWFINLLPALGEEIGWRGWLTPQLLPLGIIPTILITGVIWGLWHTPIILLGHNYPTLPGWQAVLFMVIFCTLIGAVLAWLTIRTNSVWPAALGHSTINALAGVPLLFSADTSIDSAHVGLTGTTGWITTGLLVVVLVATRSFKPARVPAIDPKNAWPTDYPTL